MADLHDTFTGVHGTNLSAHTGESGHVWTVQGAAKIQTMWDGAYFYNGPLYWTELGFADQVAEFTWDSWISGDGFMLRWSYQNGYNDGIYVWRSDYNLQLTDIAAGQAGQSIATMALLPSYFSMAFCRCTLVGDQLTVEFSSVDQGSDGDRSATYTVPRAHTGTGLALYPGTNKYSLLGELRSNQVVGPTELAATIDLAQGLGADLSATALTYAELSAQLDTDLATSGDLSDAPSGDARLTLSGSVAEQVGPDSDLINGPGGEAVDTMELVLAMWASAEVEVVQEREITPGAISRAAHGTVVQVATPQIITGRPVISAYPASYPATSGVGEVGAVGSPGGIHTEPEPDPPPPPGGDPAKMVRWVSSDLALTGEFMDSWPARGSGPSWVSRFPYRPKLKAHQHYGAGGSKHTLTNAVFYNPDYIEHMWLDVGAGGLSQPFTWLIAGIMLAYPKGGTTQHLLDAGREVPQGSYALARQDRVINDKLGYRAVMQYDSRQGIVATRTRIADGVYVRHRHRYAPRPRVYAAVFNGKSSLAGVLGHGSTTLSRGTVDPATPRFFVSGRQQNHLSDNRAAHMLIFEMRLLKDTALDAAGIRAHYRQLASAYSFASYGRDG